MVMGDENLISTLFPQKQLSFDSECVQSAKGLKWWVLHLMTNC
jgi:hypothetical protein